MGFIHSTHVIKPGRSDTIIFQVLGSQTQEDPRACLLAIVRLN